MTPTIDYTMLELPLTEDRVRELRQVDRVERARFYDRKAQQIEERERRNYVELGLVLVEMERGELFKEILDPWCFLCQKLVPWQNGICPNCEALQRPFHSFDRWLNTRAPVSAATGYRAKRAIEAGMEAGLSVEAMTKIHRTNLNVIAELSPRVRNDPQVLEVAQRQTENNLREHIAAHHPDQHIEGKERMILNPEHSTRKMIDEAILAAEVLYEVPGREAAIEHICGAWLSEPCQLEEFAGLNNMQAYERRRRR